MFYNWYDPTTGDKLTTWPERRQHASTRSCPASTTAGWPPPCMVVAHAEPRWPTRPTRSATRWTSAASTTRARPGDGARSAAASGTRPAAPGARRHRRLLRHGPGRLVHLPPLRRVQHRAADRVATSASPRGQIPAKHYYGTWRTFPDDLRLDAGPRPSRSASDADLPTASTSSRAPTLPRHAHRPELGRQHVRGADAAAVRARGDVGPAELGRQPPAVRPGPDPARARSTRGYGYWGFSPSNNPAGGYREYGVDALGLEPRRLHLRPGAAPTTTPAYGGCRAGRPTRTPTLRRRRRHAARVVPRAALRAGRRRSPTSPSFEADFDAYGRGGFYDAVAVHSAARSPSATSRSTRG